MTLSCLVHPAAALDAQARSWLIEYGTRPDSDFQVTLNRQLPPAGTIAIVRDGDEIVGWARTEPWTDDDHIVWPTLEAFVVPSRRRNGIAAFAASGLMASGGRLSDQGYVCAVFSPLMLLVAHKAGLHPTLFEKVADKTWVRA